MKVQFFSTANEFLSIAGKRLEHDEARWGLVLGLARIVVDNPHRYGSADPWFCAALEGDILRAVALRTPPYKVLLAHVSGDPAALADELVAAVAKKNSEIPGVSGDKELADKFAALWSVKQKIGINAEFTVNQRIYKLTKVNDLPLSPGHFQKAIEKDLPLVKQWADAFHLHTRGDVRVSPENDASFYVSKGWVYFWVDGKPVSMAMKSRPTEHGTAVGYVYTPPDLRGHGYAGSCVAELSRDILKSGCKFCTLYTNLANPVSNSIYIKIGYKPVSDSTDFTFST
jgi:predicted GNAT family acetyltransferase